MAGAAEARPGIDEQLEDVDYVVAGITPAEIRRDLDSKHAGGFDASLGWRVTWTFRRDLDGSSSCRLAAPRVTLRMKRTMPRLGSTTGRDGVVDAQWAAYLVALGRHEAGHQANAAAAANDVLEALAGFAGQPCLSADRAAGECARSIIAEHRRLDGEYDARTRHGAADGARFP
jgi:predicted secreted Zn-dependent protease